MNLSGITQALETINIRPDKIHDEQLSETFRILLQLIEELVGTSRNYSRERNFYN